MDCSFLFRLVIDGYRNTAITHASLFPNLESVMAGFRYLSLIIQIRRANTGHRNSVW